MLLINGDFRNYIIDIIRKDDKVKENEQLKINGL